MALPPQMVDMAMGPGGSSELMPEEMQIDLPMGEELPEGIELVGEEEMIRRAIEESERMETI